MMNFKYAPYSFSRLVSYERCPHAWKLEYIDGVKPPDTPEQKLGTVAHCVVETYLRDLITLGIPEDRNLLARIVNEYAELEGLPELRDFRFAIPPLPENPEKCEIEKWVALDVKARPVPFDSPDAFLRGRIDFHFQTPYQASISEVTIIDWKTNLPANPDDRQIAFYAILLAFEYKVELFEVVMHGLRQGVSYKRKVAREELRPTWEWILSVVDRIETEKEWPPRSGPHCKWCGYLGMGLCPIGRDVPVPTDSGNPLGSVEFPEVAPPKTPEEAKKLAAFLKVVDVLRDRLREALRPWCNEHGPVEINGEAFGVWQKETIAWKSAKAKDALTKKLIEAGIPREEVWNVLDVSKRNLKSLLKKHNREELIPELEGLGERVTSSRLEWKSLH